MNTIREIFTLEIFTVQRAFIKMALFKYFKVDKRVKEDNSDVVLSSSSESLAKTIPSSQNRNQLISFVIALIIQVVIKAKCFSIK